MIKYGQKNMSLEEKFNFNAFVFSYKTVLHATITPTFAQILFKCKRNTSRPTSNHGLYVPLTAVDEVMRREWGRHSYFDTPKGIRKCSCILLLYFLSIGPCEHTKRVSRFVPFRCASFVNVLSEYKNPRTKWSMTLILSMMVWQFDHKLFQQTFWRDLSTTDWIVLLTVQGNCKTSTNTRVDKWVSFSLFFLTVQL